MTPSSNGTTTLTAALAYLRDGQSVIPIARGGGKLPLGRALPEAWDEASATYKSTWAPFMERLPTEDEARAWYGREPLPGIGTIGGRVSGNLEHLDFDHRAEVIFPEWCELVEAESPGLLAGLCVVRTPREPAGFHVRYRCPGVTIPGSTKLAEDPDAPRNQRTLIETRGEGGYALAPGSPPECHENNRPYLHLSGPEPSRLQGITPAERGLLWRCAAAFDLRPVEEEKVKGGTSEGKAAGRTFTMGTSPGDDFNARGWEWEKILTCWKEAANRGRERRWRRPDKDKGWSATTGVCFSKANRWELLKVFSSNAAPFEPGGTYSKFAAYALLHHGGDFKAAAQTLHGLGYGTRREGQKAQAGAGERRKPYRPLPAFIPFPLDSLPPVLAAVVPAAAGAIGCDTALVAVPALAVAAGCVGNARALVLKRGWVEPAVLWSATVAESGGHKTPGYQAVVGPLLDVQFDLLEAHREKVGEYEKKRREWATKDRADRGSEPEAPAEPREFVTSDATIEALGVLLGNNPHGVLLARDELDGWFQGFTRYKGKAGGTDRPQWLELHKAGPIILNRLTREQKRLAVRRAAVSITGTIQPGVLAGALDRDALQAGLGARFLLSMPPSRRRVWTEAELPEEVSARYRQLLMSLLSLPLADVTKIKPYYLGLSYGAKRLWVEFYNQWGEVQHLAEGEQASAFAKIEAYASRLALLHHVITEDVSGGPRTPRGEGSTLPPVTEASMRAGIALARWFAAEAVRIYAMLHESQEERETRKLVEWVGARGGRVTVRQLQRGNSRKWPSGDLAEAALQVLVQAGLGRWEDGPARDGGERLTRWFVLTIPPDTSDTLPEAGEEASDTYPDTFRNGHEGRNGRFAGTVWGNEPCKAAGSGPEEEVSEVSNVEREETEAHARQAGEGVSEEVSDGHGDAYEGR